MDSKEESDDDNCEKVPFFRNAPEPKDRFYLVYIILCLLGMASLFPWNFFITANQYFQHKLRPLNSSSNNTLSEMFENYVALASGIPTTITLLLNPFLHKWVSQKSRMVFSLIIVINVFLVTTIFIKLDTDAWQYTFFTITMVSIVIMNLANGLFQSCLIGLTALFPPRYMLSMLTGQALAGILAPLADIFSLLGDPHPIESAVGYFVSALVVLCLALALYLIFLTMPFTKYYLYQGHSSDDLEPSNTLIQQDDHQILILGTNNKISQFQILKKIWIPCLACGSIFFVTLTLYPSVVKFVQSTNQFKNSNSLTGIFFTPVCCFLLFNLSDFVGRTVSGWILWPSENQDILQLILCLLRLLFLPLFILCNIYPPSRLPVVFNNDVYFILFIVMFGFSNGYLCCIVMMFAPKKVSAINQESAGTVLSAILAFGIVGGSIASYVVVKLILKL